MTFGGCALSARAAFCLHQSRQFWSRWKIQLCHFARLNWFAWVLRPEAVHTCSLLARYESCHQRNAVLHWHRIVPPCLLFSRVPTVWRRKFAPILAVLVLLYWASCELCEGGCLHGLIRICVHAFLFFMIREADCVTEVHFCKYLAQTK